MKLWEFFNAFRWSGNSPFDLLHNPKWRKPFGEYYDQLSQIVDSQDRSILDSYIPLELSRAVSAECTDINFTITDDGNIRKATHNSQQGSSISALYIHDYFGGAIIEEVMEKGSYLLPKHLFSKYLKSKNPT